MIIMAKCPKCKKEVTKPDKKWKYGRFTVQAYTCDNCKTQFREYYDKNGKHSFTLKLQKGKGYTKA
jgi:transposase-like protein